jgi:hypothetical protein
MQAELNYNFIQYMVLLAYFVHFLRGRCNHIHVFCLVVRHPLILVLCGVLLCFSCVRYLVEQS